MTNHTTSIDHTFKLGGDLTVNRLGYGAMRLSGEPENFGAYLDWEGGKKLLRRAINLVSAIAKSLYSVGVIH
jgi:pyridoxine 4-dehydrogenase